MSKLTKFLSITSLVLTVNLVYAKDEGVQCTHEEVLKLKDLHHKSVQLFADTCFKDKYGNYNKNVREDRYKEFMDTFCKNTKDFLKVTICNNVLKKADPDQAAENAEKKKQKQQEYEQRQQNITKGR